MQIFFKEDMRNVELTSLNLLFIRIMHFNFNAHRFSIFIEVYQLNSTVNFVEKEVLFQEHNLTISNGLKMCLSILY